MSLAEFVGTFSPRPYVFIDECFMRPTNFISSLCFHQDRPFVFYREQDDYGRELVGNDRFTGYCIDLLKEIAKIVPNFKYEIHIVYDGNYGSPNDANEPKNTKWNGMVGELIEKVNADIALGCLHNIFLFPMTARLRLRWGWFEQKRTKIPYLCSS
jgi:hypothetical protein